MQQRALRLLSVHYRMKHGSMHEHYAKFFTFVSVGGYWCMAHRGGWHVGTEMVTRRPVTDCAWSARPAPSAAVLQPAMKLGQGFQISAEQGAAGESVYPISTCFKDDEIEQPRGWRAHA
eukprot:jgi/Ulvmu1/11357/UM075_0017.1